MKLYQRKRIVAGFGVALLLIAAAGVFAYISINKLEDMIGMTAHTHRTVEALDHILSDTKDAEIAVRSFVISGDTSYLSPYLPAYQTVNDEIRDLTALTKDSIIKSNDIDTLQSIIGAQFTIFQWVITKREEGTLNATVMLAWTSDENRVMQRLVKDVKKIHGLEKNVLISRGGGTIDQLNTAQNIVIFGMSFGFAFIVLALMLLRRDMRRRQYAEDALQQSEERYREMITGAGDIVYRTDAGARIIFCNPAASRISKFAENELIGKHYLELVHPDARQEVQEFYTRQRQEKIPNTYFEFPLLTKDGEKRWLGQNLQVIMHNGVLEGFQAIARDITAIKNAEHSLQESELRFRGIFEHTPIGIAVLNLDGKLLQVNNALEEMVGYSAEELYAMPSIASITHPDDIAVSKEILSRISVKKLPVASFEKRYIHSDGHIIWALVNSALITDAASKPLYILGQIQDISYRKKTEDEIYSLNKQLAEKIGQLEIANKDLEAFSSSVSHDLRSPLQSVMGFAFLLRETAEEKLGDQEKEFLSNIETSGKRMQEIIEDMLTLAHTAQNEFKPECVELSAMAHEIANNLRTAQPERNVEFAIQDNVTVNGDKRLLRILLDNLLGNAWKYSSKHPDARIELGDMPSGEGAQTIFIRDDGAGFDMKYADVMFDPFKRLHTAKDFPGTGVGLAIVQRIVQRHGGTIRAEGAVEKGATFYITLPKNHSPEGDEKGKS